MPYDIQFILWAKPIRRVLYNSEGKRIPAGVCTLKYSYPEVRVGVVFVNLVRLARNSSNEPISPGDQY